MANDLRPIRPAQRDLIQRAFAAWNKQATQEHRDGLLFLTPGKSSPITVWERAARWLLP